MPWCSCDVTVVVPGEWHKALYAYTAEDGNQLTLAPGDYVDVVEREESGWWKGYNENSGGWFPASYVEKVDLGEEIFGYFQRNDNKYL